MTGVGFTAILFLHIKLMIESSKSEGNSQRPAVGGKQEGKQAEWTHEGNPK